MGTETDTGSATMTSPGLAAVADDPAHRMSADQAVELLLEMAALTRIALGAHRAAGGFPAEPPPPAPAVHVPDVPVQPAPIALEVPALAVPSLDVPPQVSDHDRLAVLDEVAFLDE